MKKYKLRKEILLLILFLLLLLILFLIKKNGTNSYSLEYKIDEFNISENYEKEQNVYYFEIKEGKDKYNFISEIKYQKKKRLIKNIKKIEKEEEICLLVESDYLKAYPICKIKGEQVDYHLMNASIKEEIQDYFKENEEKKETYKKYTLYNREEHVIVWNYKGFISFSEENKEEYSLFNKDIYNISLATQINEYILIPDYEQEYSFNRIYLINLKKNKIDTWELKENISFDSYILGTNNKSIFLVDNKNKKEYELVPHKKKMRVVGSEKKKGILYKEGKEEQISLAKLTKEKGEFLYKNNYKFVLEDKKLYLSYLNSPIKELISTKEIDKIIKINKETVYYLVKDTLYKYNKEKGEIRIIQYEDWEFNHDNLIFLYNEI